MSSNFLIIHISLLLFSNHVFFFVFCFSTLDFIQCQNIKITIYEKAINITFRSNIFYTGVCG